MMKRARLPVFVFYTRETFTELLTEAGIVIVGCDWRDGKCALWILIELL